MGWWWWCLGVFSTLFVFPSWTWDGMHPKTGGERLAIPPFPRLHVGSHVSMASPPSNEAPRLTSPPPTAADSQASVSPAPWLAMLRPTTSQSHPRESRLVGLLLAAKLGVLSTSAGRMQVLEQLQGQDTWEKQVVEDDGEDQAWRKQAQDRHALRWLRAPLKSTQPGAVQAACAVLAALLQEKEAAKCAMEAGLGPLLADACKCKEDKEVNDPAQEKKKTEDAWRALRHLLEAVEPTPETRQEKPWDEGNGRSQAASNRDLERKVWEAALGAVADNPDARWAVRRMARQHLLRGDTSLGTADPHLGPMLDKLLDLNVQSGLRDGGARDVPNREQGKGGDLQERGEQSTEDNKRIQERNEDLRVTFDAVLAMPAFQTAIQERSDSEGGRRWNDQARKHVVAVLRTRQRGSAGTHALRLASACLQALGPRWILEATESNASALMLYLVENARIEAHVAAQSELRFRANDRGVVEEDAEPRASSSMDTFGLEDGGGLEEVAELMCLACSLMEICIDVLVLDEGTVLASVASRAISTAGRFADDMAEYLQESQANGLPATNMQVSAARSLARVLAEAPSSARNALRVILAPTVIPAGKPATAKESRPGKPDHGHYSDTMETSLGATDPRESDGRRSFLSFLFSLHGLHAKNTPVLAFFLPWMLLCASDAEWDGAQGAALLGAGAIHAIAGTLAERSVDDDLQDNACKVALLCIMTSDELACCRRTVSQLVVGGTGGMGGSARTSAEIRQGGTMDEGEYDGILWTRTDSREDVKKKQLRQAACASALPALPLLIGGTTSPFMAAFCAAVLDEAGEQRWGVDGVSGSIQQLQRKFHSKGKLENTERTLARTIADYHWNRMLERGAVDDMLMDERTNRTDNSRQQ